MLQRSTHQSSDISDGFVVLVTQLLHARKAAVGNTHVHMYVCTHHWEHIRRHVGEVLFVQHTMASHLNYVFCHWR